MSEPLLRYRECVGSKGSGILSYSTFPSPPFVVRRRSVSQETMDRDDNGDGDGTTTSSTSSSSSSSSSPLEASAPESSPLLPRLFDHLLRANSISDSSGYCEEEDDEEDDERFSATSSSLPLGVGGGCAGAGAGGFLCVQRVDAGEIGVAESCGAFRRVLAPGFHCLPWPLVAAAAGRLSLRERRLNVVFDSSSERDGDFDETISSSDLLTSDGAFCRLDVAVVYRLSASHVYDAYYSSSSSSYPPDNDDPSDQIRARTVDAVRSAASTATLEEIAEDPDLIFEALVFPRLRREVLQVHGYEVVTVRAANAAPSSDAALASLAELEASRRHRREAPIRAGAAEARKVEDARARAEAEARRGVDMGEALQKTARRLKPSEARLRGECVFNTIDFQE